MQENTNNTITMPKQVYDAVVEMLGEFLWADLEPRCKYFRESDDEKYHRLADRLEAAADIYETWRGAREVAAIGD